jgi:LmbE family N-acetylglucosaminyl deacetylase
MKKPAIFSLFLLFSFSLLAQQPVSLTSADMYQAIKKLNVLGSVLYVAAHPDDENTRLIAYLSKEKLYRIGYLSVTRGDGGQNLIGEEQGIELGLIRTQELLAARRIDGGEQFFTRAFDFGYSKSPEETFSKWDKEKILSDVVWVIRKFQPDVVITRFPATGEGGHGHHTASAILANDAYTAAADTNRFPEQLKYVQPWQVKRVLWNTFNFGGTNTQREDQYKLDVGGYNPLLGKSYGEIAAESRSQHKSQGFGVPAGRGEAMEYFKATQGDQPVNDLMEGVDLSWKKVNGAAAIEKMVDNLAVSFDFLHPEKSVKGLVELFRTLETLPAGFWRDKKLEETKQLIAQCSGLWLDVFTQEQYAVQTDSIRFNFQFNNRLGVNATLKKVSVDGFDSSVNQVLAKNRNVNFAKTFFVPATKPITQPYWLENKMEEGYFTVSDQARIGIPDVQPSYLVNLLVNIEGIDLNFIKAVKYKFTDPVKGEVYQPLVVIPAITVRPDGIIKISKDGNGINGVLSFTARKKDLPITARYNFRGNYMGEEIKFTPLKLNFPEKNRTGDISYQLKTKQNRIYSFSAINDLSGEIYSQTPHEIKYDHIPLINYYTPADVANKNIDVKTYGRKIGYITGAGDKVPEALEQMGYQVTPLDNKELSRNNLNQFDAIITGVRAYNTNEWMNNHYDKLMKYVENGGNLIVQYNTNNFLGGVRSKMGPYPFVINRNRITNENAPVTILKPEHPVFNFPNKITADDFSGWVQERSIYHATDSSGKFEELIAMNDAGEKPDDGSLLVTRYGKGYFTYTGLVFFRQLPAGVPGAYRLLANLIALNRKKAF